MAGVSEAQIRSAREMTAIEYLRKYQPSRLKKSSARNEWELTDHDSFKINEITGKWHWKSRDIGGISALNFLIKVDGMEFTEAVRLLAGETPSYIPQELPCQERKPFVLPKPNGNNRRVIRYLNERGISDTVIRYCMKQGILYESESYHNAVFLGKDGDGKARYAFLRGIYDKDGKKFRIEQAGSEKAYGFCIEPSGKSRRVAVYEACIDALAHMTLEGGRTDKYRLVLGGISAPKEGSVHRSRKLPATLTLFLNQHPEVQEIELCFDNDFAGRWACEHIRSAYAKKYKVVENLPGIEGADYGDIAQSAILQKRQRTSRSVQGR